MNYDLKITSEYEEELNSFINLVLDKAEAQLKIQSDPINTTEFLNDIKPFIREQVKAGCTNVDELIDRAYTEGRKRGYRGLGLSPDKIVWTNQDKETLNQIKDYNFGLIRDIGDQLRDSIKLEVLAGVASGDNSKVIASQIKDLADFNPLPDSGLSPIQRARMIARTEVHRARTSGQLTSFKQYGASRVILAPRDDACELCIDLAETYNPVPIEDADGILPVHPNCACDWIIDRDSIDYDEPDNGFESVEAVPADLRGD